MRVYRGNYDGQREAMVGARNQKEAAAALRTSVYSLRQYYEGSKPVTDEEIAASLEPGVVWVRKMTSRDPWTRLRPTEHAS